MRREGVFSSVITLEKSKNQKKTKKQGSTLKKQGSTLKKQGSTLKKQGSTLKKSQGKEKMQFCGNLGSAENTTNRLIFWKKKSESHPSFFISKKKKILKMKKS